MIKILEYANVPASEVFSRVVPEVDVSGIVSDIIANVRLFSISFLKSAKTNPPNLNTVKFYCLNRI